MKTIKKIHGLINLLIVVVMTIFGILLGSLTGQIRIGAVMGFDAGLIGITAFYYWLSLHSMKMEEKMLITKRN